MDHTNKTVISTTLAPRALGPYSQGVGFQGFYFLSGQIGIDPTTAALVEGGVEAQIRQVMENISHVLLAAGLSFEHVLKSTIYLKNMSDFELVNRVYGEFFHEHPPARATIEVSRLPKDALVEVEVVAASPTPSDVPDEVLSDVPEDVESRDNPQNAASGTLAEGKNESSAEDQSDPKGERERLDGKADAEPVNAAVASSDVKVGDSTIVDEEALEAEAEPPPSADVANGEATKPSAEDDDQSYPERDDASK